MKEQRIPCACLRTKMFYIHEASGIRYLQETIATESYWCTHRMAAVGPDDRPAEPNECLSGRACYMPMASAIELLAKMKA